VDIDATVELDVGTVVVEDVAVEVGRLLEGARLDVLVEVAAVS